MSPHSSGRSPAGRDVAGTLYRLLLRLLPAAFRARNASAMEEAFAALYAGARRRGAWATAALWVRECIDLVRTGLTLRFRPRTSELASTVTSSRGSGRLSMFGSLRDDWHLAIRSTTRNRAFFLLASLTLALGVGATTAMYSALKSIVLEPFPFPGPDRMVTLHRLWGSQQGARLGLKGEDIAALREGRDVFTAVEAGMSGAATLTGFDAPERIRVYRMTPGLASLIGLDPVLGRIFTENDVDGDGQQLLLISHAMWRERFAGRRDVIGSLLHIDGAAWTIIGVAPRTAVPPTSDPRPVDVWLPLADRYPFRNTIARLADGVSPTMATARVDAIVRRDSTHHGGGTAQPLIQEKALDDHLRILMIAVTLLLLVACVNVSNLLLQRASVRMRETAVRVALGAGRGRLLRQFLLESTVLAAAGGILGAALSHIGLRIVLALRPDRLAALDRVRIDGDVLLFCMASAALAGMLFGVLPAMHGSRVSGVEALGRLAAGSDGTQTRFRWILITAEVALSFALLVGAALTVASLRELSTRDPGYDTEGLVAVDVRLPSWRYGTDASRVSVLERMAEAMRQLPYVQSISLADGVPPQVGGARFGRLHVEGRAPETDPTILESFEVDATFLETLRLRVIAGRSFSESDANSTSLNPVIVSASTARRLFGGERAVGQRFRQEGRVDYTVVGVVPDIRGKGLADDGAFPLVYWLRKPSAPDRMVRDRMMIVVRVLRPDAQSMLDLRQIVRRSEPDALVEIQTVREMLGASLAQERFTTSLLTTFAGLAVVLAAIGLYGVLSQVVVARTREIGVRIALGADAARIRTLVLRSGVLATLVGLAVGAAIAAVGLRVLRGQLFGLTDAPLPVYMAAAAVLLLVSLAAMLVPASRAARLDPMRTMRVE